MKSFLLLLLLSLSLNAATLNQVITGLEGAEVYDVLPTGSMLPAFSEKDVLLVHHADRAPWKSLKRGDIILVWATINGEISIVCHAIWTMSSGGTIVLTKGYNNSAPDPWEVREDAYVGKVIGTMKREALGEVKVKPVRFVLDGVAKGK